MRDKFDRGSKWLIQRHGDSILRLGGVTDVVSWKPIAAELVQPKQLPDGLLEVFLAAEPAKPAPFLIEIATYPEERLIEQVVRDAMLVFLDRREVPDVVTLILRPKGNLRIADRQVFASIGGTTRVEISWRVVELWNVRAEKLLEIGDIGLVPWIPLTQFAEPPEAMLAECRRRIDAGAMPDEHESLLVVSQILAQLRYNQEALLQLFGGRTAMIESPLIQEIVTEVVAEKVQGVIEAILASRFTAVPPEISLELRTIDDAEKLQELGVAAARCVNLAEFRARLSG